MTVHTNQGNKPPQEELLEKSTSATDRYLEEKKEKVTVQKELYDQYVIEEELLRKYNNLDEQYKSLKRKYDSLSQSKLGKLTVKYWEWRRKRRN